jgi:hypothetical protein
MRSKASEAKKARSAAASGFLSPCFVFFATLAFGVFATLAEGVFATLAEGGKKPSAIKTKAHRLQRRIAFFAPLHALLRMAASRRR